MIDERRKWFLILLSVGLCALLATHATAQGPVKMSTGGATGAPESVGGPDVLWDQTSFNAGIGITFQAFEAAFTDYDSQAADDFIVSWVDWSIDQVNIDVRFLPAGGTPDAVSVDFYADDGGFPAAAPIAGCSYFELTSYVFTNAGFRIEVSLPTPCVLSPGTYWVAIQARMDFLTDGQVFWDVSTVQTNSGAVWRNPGLAFAPPACPDWDRVTDCLESPTTPDMVFQLLGTEVCADNPQPRTQGYWNRQCLGIPEDQGGIDPGRNGRGPSEPTEPGFKDFLAEIDLELENSLFEFDGTCQGGINADPPSDPCEKATKQYTALLLNEVSHKLQLSCNVDVSSEGCTSTEVEWLLDELASLIQSGDPANCQLARDCAGAVNEGTALVERAGLGATGAGIVATDSTSSGHRLAAAAVEKAPVAGDQDPTGLVPGDDVAVFSVTGETAARTADTWEADTEITEEHTAVVTDDPLEDIEHHLAVLSNPSAHADALSVSVDALLTALGGGYDPEVRLEIVERLMDTVDIGLHSLLFDHLTDILAEVEDFGRENLALRAKALQNRLEPNEK
jgi:hypothetical protein